jgi:hypothetical protein
MPLVVLAAYTAPDRTARRVAVLVLGPPLTVSRPPAAVLAARLSAHPALVLDEGDDEPGDVRVVGELRAGEGLAAVRALIDDYLPRARRATRPLARPLEPDDLLAPCEGENAGSERTERERWAA